MGVIEKIAELFLRRNLFYADRDFFRVSIMEALKPSKKICTCWRRKWNGQIAEDARSTLFMRVSGYHKEDVESTIALPTNETALNFTHAPRRPCLMQVRQNHKCHPCFYWPWGMIAWAVYDTLKQELLKISWRRRHGPENVHKVWGHRFHTSAVQMAPAMVLSNVACLAWCTARYVDQGGVNARCVRYLLKSQRHAGVLQFLDLPQNHGKGKKCVPATCSTL